MPIKNDEFLNLFDKTGKKIKTGELGNDNIEIDGLSKGDKVSQGDYTVGIQSEHEDNSHAVFGVPGFSAVSPEVKMESFDIDNKTLAGETGSTGTIKVSNIKPTGVTNVKINATSSDTSIATVKDNGDASYTVTYVKAGSATIKLIADDGSKVEQDVAVTVTDPKSEDPKE